MFPTVDVLLIVVFVVHLVAFLISWVRTRKLHSIIFVFGFALLIGANLLRLFARDVLLFGHPVFWLPRALSWLVLAAGTLTFARYLWRRRAQRDSRPKKR
jgi:hypothetical protein